MATCAVGTTGGGSEPDVMVCNVVGKDRFGPRYEGGNKS